MRRSSLFLQISEVDLCKSKGTWDKTDLGCRGLPIFVRSNATSRDARDKVGCVNRNDEGSFLQPTRFTNVLKKAQWPWL